MLTVIIDFEYFSVKFHMKLYMKLWVYFAKDCAGCAHII